MASTSSEHGGESSEAPPPTMVSGDQRLMIYGGLTKKAKRERGCTAKERISKMPPCTAGKRSSIYRGVTRHRWTGRYEAHLWDKSTWNQNQNKKGKQVYLGAYDDEEAAARAYDLAALKYWGPGTLINFPVTDYTRDLEEMQNVSREDYLASLRRKSSGFARGISKYRPLSRLESQFGHSPGPLNGDETASGSEYAGHFSAERKIDLSNYIKWWGQQHKSNPSDLRSRILDEARLVSPEDVATELRALESSIKPTEPYEMPRLGTPVKQVKDKKISAMSILEKSAAYKSLQERTAKKKDKEEDNEDDNKDNIDKVDNLGKSIDQSCDNDRFQRLSAATFAMSEGLSSIQTNVYPLGPLLSSPLLTSYNSIDPLTDHILWNSLAPVYPGGPSRTNEVMKVESSSDYAFFQQGDQHYAQLISDVKTKSDHTQSGLGE